MNDATPRRLTGSLLERAADRFAFAPAKVAIPSDIFPVAPAKAGAHPGVRHAPAAEGSADGPLPPQGRQDIAGSFSAPPPRRRAANRTGTIDRDRLIEQGLILPGAPVTGLAEEFRIVKRQLMLAARGDAKARRILICSAQPGEGKSFCAVNLALSMAAEKDVEILLVDADFAKAEVPVMLGLDAGIGLLDALADPAIDIESAVIRTDVPQLSVLSAGTRSHDDTELLASDRTAALLDDLQAADPRRILIFDSPPALAASPASTLAHQVGHVVMVVRADRTNESELREAVMLLDGCDDLQLLLNGARFAPGGKRFGTYYGYGS
ncbi:exopolysaccharide biosynthesis protein [Sphingomonas gilva]|uniref:Exopolysaccharide biosynthesis protein n=1 Tax=Sphingomonas gilva TaxID=2305907 RepID=A0A396RLR8_9SPHN|nr:P-loop NTPase [Sphingomonas gilva]RHW17314.1 exopolysaccharide biosynthesis protein [Sphingomonas gilva]